MKNSLFTSMRKAEETAAKTGRASDIFKAKRLKGAFQDQFVPQSERWPRHPKTNRILAPSEFRREQ